jgi:hypothetical protein
MSSPFSEEINLESVCGSVLSLIKRNSFRRERKKINDVNCSILPHVQDETPFEEGHLFSRVYLIEILKGTVPDRSRAKMQIPPS